MRRKMLWILSTLTLTMLASTSNAGDLRQPDLLPTKATASKNLVRTDSFSKDSAGKGPVISAALSEDDVGDVASFGRNVKWLGVAQTLQVSLRDDCTGSDPAIERCITLAPQPGFTSFNERDLAYLTLPGKSAKSLLCQWITPFWQYQFHNLTGVDQGNAQISLTPYISIENEVLNDPAAIDPNTGLPYGGVIESGLAMTHYESRSLTAGARHDQRLNYSRVCIAGIISANFLEDAFGLPADLADKFLKKETTIRFHLRGNASMIDQGSLFYGIRLVGD